MNPYGHYCPLDFKSSVSTNSTTRACLSFSRQQNWCVLSERRPRSIGRTRDQYLKSILSASFFAILSERRDLNPRPPPWQGDALPLSYFRVLESFPNKNLNLVNLHALLPKLREATFAIPKAQSIVKQLSCFIIYKNFHLLIINARANLIHFCKLQSLFLLFYR